MGFNRSTSILIAAARFALEPSKRISRGGLGEREKIGKFACLIFYSSNSSNKFILVVRVGEGISLG